MKIQNEKSTNAQIPYTSKQARVHIYYYEVTLTAWNSLTLSLSTPIIHRTCQVF